MTRTVLLLSIGLTGLACDGKDDNTAPDDGSTDSAEDTDGTDGTDGTDEADEADEADEVEEVAKEEVDSKIDQCQKLYRKFHKIKNKMGKFVVCNGLLGRNYLQQVQTRI